MSVTRAEYYHERANHCERLAETMAKQEDMFRFQKAASEWRKLAQQFDGLAQTAVGGTAPR